MPNLPRKFIDYDLSIVPPGQNTGLVKESDEQIARAMGDKLAGNFSDIFPEKMVSRTEWKPRIDKVGPALRRSVTSIYSQLNEGSCVGFGQAQSAETKRRRLFGKKFWVSLSGMSIYKRIGSSPNSGAMISDGMKASLDGILPVNSTENQAAFKHTHPRTGFRTPLASGWIETGREFRVARWARASGVEEIMTVLLLGYTGIVGRSGHCVPYIAPAYDGNSFFADYANSWDKDWGDDGHGYDSERTMNSVTLYIILDMVRSSYIDVPQPE